MVAVPQIPEEMRGIVRRYRKAFATVAALSAVLNVLVLGGSLYMMLVYDSVLPSHSLSTLAGLLVLLIGVYAFQGVFDGLRSRILADIAGAFDRALSRRVQRAMSEQVRLGGQPSGDGLGPMRDLESIRTFLSGPGPTTLIDMPWMIFFFAILTMLHVWIGLTALIGGALLVTLTYVTERMTKGPTEQLGMIAAYRNAHAEANLQHADVYRALGMQERMLDRWQHLNGYYLAAQRRINRSVTLLGGISKMGRMLLQSLILTVGAILVIQGKASGGVIFASSILSARALAPVDQAIGNWRSFVSARLGWRRLCDLLAQVPDRVEVKTILPRPTESLRVEQLVLAPPGAQRITVQGVDFSLSAGDGLAIIGPSAAGKSSLGRALLGIWQPVRGAVRLDGASLDQWPSDMLGQHIGYLPQTVELIDGTVADNIARFHPDATSEDVIAAAKAAAVHEMIVGLPGGYESDVGVNGRNLSIGQQQRIALARALYRDPFLVLLDEPNSNLDAEGDAALEQAIASIRMRRGIVIVIAHRPSALAKVNLVLVMRDGRQEIIGKRDEVMARLSGRSARIDRDEVVGGVNVKVASAA
ncbi:MAG TPA: type I secretion system permease/ATPase [Sphingobium sp.]|uniref:type I secretion system permease/ATPase n=1 Tax=Sphingobium sp. TaxID=1912891 RepID=UPI002ED25B2E